MSDHDVLVWRRVTAGLLTLLVGGTLLLVGVVSFEFLRRQNETTQALIAKVQADLVKAAEHREKADQLALRVLHLEGERIRLAVLLETCVVLRLEGQHLAKCHDVKAKAGKLVGLIRDFRQRIRTHAAEAVPQPAGTVTVTKAPPPDHVGESSNCPPNNPHC